MTEHDDSLNWGILTDSIGLRIRLAETLSAQQIGRLLQHEDVSPALLTALELIGCNPGIQPGRLARAMALEPSNVASVLRRLEALGWVSTEAGQDRRTRVVSLTSSGENRRQNYARFLQAHQKELIHPLSRDETDELLRLLNKLIR